MANVTCRNPLSQLAVIINYSANISEIVPYPLSFLFYRGTGQVRRACLYQSQESSRWQVLWILVNYILRRFDI